MKKGIKKYIIIIIVLIIYCGFMYFTFGISENKKRKTNVSLLVGDSTVWNYTSGDWMNVTSQKSLSSLNWKKFNIYVDNQYFGNYLIWLDNQVYLFDKNHKAIPYQGMLFGYKSNFEMDVLSFNSSTISNFSYAKKVLSNHQLDVNSPYTLSTVSSLDFDQDGQNEDFYFISNVFANDFFPEKYFSFAFMVKNDKIYMLYEDVDKNDGVNGCKPNLYSVADVDNDSNYELILSCSKYSNQVPIMMLYEFLNDEFKIVISNQ